MLYYVRHGERADIEDQELHKTHCEKYPPTDPTLTKSGFEMATETGKYFNSIQKKEFPEKKYVILTSPYLRCLQTARNIAKELEPDSLLTNTIYVEQGLEEWYSSNASQVQSSRDDLIFHTLPNNPELSSEIFQSFPYKYNSLLTNNHTKSPLFIQWEESLRDASSRCIFR